MSTSNDFAVAAQSLAAALLASTTDPVDGIRALSGLANFTPAALAYTSVIGQAMGTMQGACSDLFRRTAVVALARASATYQPSSYDDAVAVRNQVCALLDAEIEVAGDQSEDATFNALRALRAAVVQDMIARGADLATIVTVDTNHPLPAPVLSQRLYRDPNRTDELVANGDPVHPAFMPIAFKALSS